MSTSDLTLRALANNETPKPLRTRPRRLRLAERVGLAAAIDLTDAIYVGPGSEWASPITWSDVGGQFPSLDDHGIGQLIVRDFEVLARNGCLSFPNWRHLGGERGPVNWTYPPLEKIRRELGGHDLACSCELTLPCHADVLLKLANEAS